MKQIIINAILLLFGVAKTKMFAQTAVIYLPRGVHQVAARDYPTGGTIEFTHNGNYKITGTLINARNLKDSIFRLMDKII